MEGLGTPWRGTHRRSRSREGRQSRRHPARPPCSTGTAACGDGSTAGGTGAGRSSRRKRPTVPRSTRPRATLIALSIDWATGWVRCFSCGDAWAIRVEDHPDARMPCETAPKPPLKRPESPQSVATPAT